VPLKTQGLMIGASLDARIRDESVSVPLGSSLYLFSDGVFEIVTKDQRQWRLADFLPLVLEPSQEGVPESKRLHEAVISASQPGPLDDDFSLVVVTFP
jgi:sigma-B regulation protein RsbU (phosphoserine phosphatase)